MVMGGNSALAQSDFESEKNRSERRYQDFYQRFQEKKRKTFARQHLAKDHKKVRQNQKKKNDKLRRQFIKIGRKKKNQSTALPELYQAMQDKRDKDRRQVRKKYIQQKRRLQKIREKSLTIPSDQEFGL